MLPMPSTRLHEVYLKCIPTLNAFTGAHADYPMHSGTADKIDFVNAAKRVHFTLNAANTLILGFGRHEGRLWSFACWRSAADWKSALGPLAQGDRLAKHPGP